MTGRLGETLLVKNPKDLLEDLGRASLVGICQGGATNMAHPQMIKPLDL